MPTDSEVIGLLRERVAKLEGAVDDMRDDLKSAHADSVRRLDALLHKLDSLSTEHDRLKQRGIGLLIGVSLASAAGGSAMTKLVAKWIGA
jgi:hypothetical protein